MPTKKTPKKPVRSNLDALGKTESRGGVSVSYGVHGGGQFDKMPLVGKTVGDVQRQLRTMLNLPEGVTTLVNGQEATSETVLKDKDRLEFVKVSGSKG